MPLSRSRAFTLTEILVIVGIISLLAALSFPVFNHIRRRAHQATCVSNLKQLGVAVSLYTQDHDGLFPRGGDPTDLNTDAWASAANGIYEWQVDELPPLTFVLSPYIKAPKVWRCPADLGFDIGDMSGQPLDARPSSFEKFGMSYYYRTELTLKRKKDLVGWEDGNPPLQRGPSEINVLADGHGSWHGQDEPWSQRRYNVLMGDGRVVNFSRAQLKSAWRLNLDGPEN